MRIVDARASPDEQANTLHDPVPARRAGPGAGAAVVAFGLVVGVLTRAAGPWTSSGGWALPGVAAVVAACALLWPLCRRLGLGTLPAAAAVLLGGAAATLAGAPVPRAGLATLCLAAAALLAVTPGRARVAAVPVALAGVLAAPLAAVGLLALAAHLVADSSVGTGWTTRARWGICAVLGLAAVATAVLATGDRPLAVAGAGVSAATTVLVAVAFAAVAVAAWSRPRWLRPVACATLATCACAPVPGSGGVAVLLAAPVAAVLAVAVLDDRLPDGPGRRVAAAAGLLLVLLVTLPALLLGAGGAAPAPVPSAGAPSDVAASATAAWLDGELDPGLVVAAAPDVRARLREQGFPDERVVPADPAPTAAHVLVRPSTPGAAADGTVPIARLGTGADALEVRRPAAPADAVRSARERARFGAALATNPRLTVRPEDRARIAGGGLDPRLTVLLAGMVGSHAIGVGGLPAGAGAGDEPLRRTAVITTIDGVPTGDPAAADTVRRWVQAQNPPYRPDVVVRPGEPVALHFTAPSPLGLPTG